MPDDATLRAASPRRVRVRYANRLKCLLCYVISFSLPLWYQAGMLRFAYPYKLAGTAPNVAQNLRALLPFLPALPGGALEAAAMPDAGAAALTALDGAWQRYVAVCFLAGWALTLLLQLLWRFSRGKPAFPARATARAIRAYRLCMLLIWALNALAALLVWAPGVRLIAGRTRWDYLVYFGGYVLNALAAFACFRLAAPPTLSGGHAFFKRL